MLVKSAFVLAAGRGERLRPLTDTCPKPLLKVQGRPILLHLLEKLRVLSLDKVVINAWHLKEQVVEFSQNVQNEFPFEIVVVEESELLGTGGGLKNALPCLGSSPFLMINGDCLWKGDLAAFVSQAIQINRDKSAESCWALVDKRENQTSIRYRDFELTGIGRLWDSDGSSLDQEGCFTGIQLISRVEANELPDQGCIVRNYWIPRLRRGSKISIESKFPNSWEDLGTPEKFQSFKL